MMISAVAVACLLALHVSAQEPQVTTKDGSLVFSAGNKGDISFAPGNGGSLYLNGIRIKTVAELQGVKGENGTKGDVGTQGLQGIQGTQGTDGVKGDTGVTGIQGVKGDQGIQGLKGGTGIQGTKGDMGQKGAAGQDGTNGVQGVKGASGVKGDTGVAGPPGSTTTVSVPGDGCAMQILPSCPHWLNVDKPALQANTLNQVIKVATNGMSKYYNPLQEASFTCKFSSPTTGSTVSSAKAALTAGRDSVTNAIYYYVLCKVPVWKLTQPATGPQVTKEIANLTLWFQGTTEIPFAGMGSSNQVSFSVGWFNTTRLPDNSILVYGVGFNISASFLCQFTNTTKLGVTLHVNATTQLAVNSSYIRCYPPHWNFTSDTRVSLDTSIKIFEEEGTTVKFEVPFRGTPKTNDIYTYYRCSDGVSNGAETDVDCGGLCPNLCPSGAKCTADSDCAGSSCSKTTKTCGLPGQSQSSPADSCKALQYKTDGIAWIKWPGVNGGAVQTYCIKNATYAGGDWAMVWKHSYFEGPYKTRLNDMRSYSSFYQPCLGIPTSTGSWCNIPSKMQSGYTEQMVTAYYKGILVYAYRSSINSQLGKSNSGVYLRTTSRVYDRCRYNVGTRPSYSTASGSTAGITFDKASPDNFVANCDTDWNSYTYDCRWENCGLPSVISSTSSHTQMTIIIYVR